MFRSLFRYLSNSSLAGVGLLLLAILVIALTGFRTYKKYSVATGVLDFSMTGMSDFHNGAYYPSLAFREGVNPYAAECMENYPISRPAPIYSPLVFILHWPFTYFDVSVADVLFFVFNVGLIALLAWMAIKFSRDDGDEPDESDFGWNGFWLVFCILLVSRPGHMTIFTGYFTAEMVVGSLLAIHYGRTRPWLAGIGLMLSSLKPTFVIPLALLMLCRKQWMAVLLGGIFSVFVAGAGIGWLAADQPLTQVIEEIRNGQQALHDDPTEHPVFNWTRTDLAGMTAKLLGIAPGDSVYLAVMIGLLIVPGIALFRLNKFEPNGGAASLSGLIMVLAILLGIYHHSYDCLLIISALVGIAFFGSAPQLTNWERNSSTILMGIVMLNYSSTQTTRNYLGLEIEDLTWQLLTLINGICLFITIVICLRAAFRQPTATLQPTRS